MCTLIVSLHAGRLVVGANRDEALDRPAGPPRRWSFGSRLGVAPVDLQAGGTWLGVNDAGLFSALTNRFGVSRASDAPSRGRWVPRMLGCSSLEEARQLSMQPAAPENGHHLVVADRNGAFIAIHDGRETRVSDLPEGFTVVTERSHGAGRTDRLVLIERLLPREPSLASLSALLQTRTDHRPLEGVEVFAPERKYGTRSACLVELDASGLVFRYAERYPRRTDFEDFADRIQV